MFLEQANFVASFWKKNPKIVNSIDKV